MLSQRKVVDEKWSDDRIREFLKHEGFGDHENDYCILYKAYISMVPDHFCKFVEFYQAEGKDINVLNKAGESLLDQVCNHHRSQPYRTILEEAGAIKTTLPE